MAFVPLWILNLALSYPSKGLRYLKKHVALCNTVAVTLIDAKTKAFEGGHAKKDVLSLIGTLRFALC
jgi:hypothetical protein